MTGLAPIRSGPLRAGRGPRRDFGDVDKAVAKARRWALTSRSAQPSPRGGPADVGFPTRVRLLHGSRPVENLDEGAVSDRPLGMAVTAFSPGPRSSRTSRCTPPWDSSSSNKQGRAGVEIPAGSSRKACVCEDPNCGDLVLGRCIPACEVCAGPVREVDCVSRWDSGRPTTGGLLRREDERTEVGTSALSITRPATTSETVFASNSRCSSSKALVRINDNYGRGYPVRRLSDETASPPMTRSSAQRTSKGGASPPRSRGPTSSSGSARSGYRRAHRRTRSRVA